jgi:transcriptional regulator with XRE-family HTH domain
MVGGGALVAVAYVSRIGELLRARGLTVSELHRRLTAEGETISRTALDRLASDRPVADAHLAALLPVLRVLDVPIEEAFRPVDAEEAARRRRVRAATARLLRPGRAVQGADSISPEAEAALDEAIARAAAALRARRPDLFDRRGRPRKRAIARMLAEATQGGRYADEQRYASIADRAAAAIDGAGA